MIALKPLPPAQHPIVDSVKDTKSPAASQPFREYLQSLDSLVRNNQSLISGINTPVSKTGPDPVANTDKASVLVLSGGFYTVSLAAAGGYDNNFYVTIYNNDTRGKRISPSGVASFILWPLQSCLIFNTGSGWGVLPTATGQLWHLPSATTFNVDPVNGLDTNDGLAAGAGGAFKTIQKAFDIVIGELVCDFTPTIKLADGTYVEMVFASAATVGKAGGILVVGNVATPANVVWKLDGTIVPPPGATPVALVARGGVNVNVSGVAFTSVGTINATFLDAFGASISFDHVDFGPALGTQSHILVGNQALVSQNGPYTISGGSGSHIILLNGSFVYIGLTNTVTVTANITFSLCFVLVDHGYLLFDGTTTFTLTGTVTGTKYIIDFGGSAFLNSSTIPGSVAGLLLNGANIAP